MANVLDIQNVVFNTTYSTVKKNFVSDLYRNLKSAGFSVCLLNDVYLIINDVTYQFINRKKFGFYEAKAV